MWVVEINMKGNVLAFLLIYQKMLHTFKKMLKSRCKLSIDILHGQFHQPLKI